MMDFWNHIKTELESGHELMFMVVIASEESSPGRQGFKMAVSNSGQMFGSIGGGFMEYKLTEQCKEALEKENLRPFLIKQVHDQDALLHKSGMICSGEQTVAFYSLNSSLLPMVIKITESLISGDYGVLIADEQGLEFSMGESNLRRCETKISSLKQWIYKEDLGNFPVLHIIGGGHVSMALSRFASQLGFEVMVYDDRRDLYTMNENQFAKCKIIDDYGEINQHIEQGESSYVVIMSYSHRTDQLALGQLIGRDFRYLGMMGSKAKVKEIYKQLMDDGIQKEAFESVHSPVGLPISSQTPEEIAISILAELIKVKNGMLKN